MNRLTIFCTANGWLVIEGPIDTATYIRECIPGSHSFNSLDKAIAYIRQTLKSWRGSEVAS